MLWLMRLLDKDEGSSMPSELGFTEDKTGTIDSLNLENSVTRSHQWVSEFVTQYWFSMYYGSKDI
jgi:hypothetical protein